jgi:hypothetical protein
MRRKAGDAQEEADGEVRPRGSADVHPNRADQRRHPKRAENHADGPAEHADAEREPDSACKPKPLPGPCGNRPEREIDAAPHEHCRDHTVEKGLRHIVGHDRASDRSHHGREGDPRHDAPVHAPLPSMTQRARAGCGGRDRDVRPRSRDRAPAREQDERQSQGAEDESEDRAQVARDERRPER